MYKSLIRPLMSQRGKVGASEGGRALPRLHGQSLGEPAPKPGPAPPRQRHSTCSWRHPPLQRFGKRWGRLGEVSTQPESLHWRSGTLESALKTSLLPYSQSFHLLSQRQPDPHQEKGGYTKCSAELGVGRETAALEKSLAGSGKDAPGPGKALPGVESGETQAHMCMQMCTQMFTAAMIVKTKK